MGQTQNQTRQPMPASDPEFDSLFRWLLRGTSEIFPQGIAQLYDLLEEAERPLRVKFGIDPTATELHLGHSIPIRKLRAFQDAGHTAVLIVGDFTARIGDPSGRSSVRQQLSAAEVEANARDYLEQVRPILDFETPGRLEIRYNSQWLSELDLAQILGLLSRMTVGQMLAKEAFAERDSDRNPIYLHEFMYPLMQGYDSVAVGADIELGGTDQRFNIALGRDLQRYYGQQPQVGLLLPILIGTDGEKKMSKSHGNTVGLRDDALTMYSRLEKVPDPLLPSYFELLTDLDLEALPQDPRARQQRLALEVTGHYYGREAAEQAQQAALSLVRGDRERADAVPAYSLAEVAFPAKLFYILKASGLCSSSGEGRRQIAGGAVRLDGDRITDTDATFDSPAELAGKTLQVGKKRFMRLEP